MPEIYRSMKEEAGKPMIGDGFAMLGVRVPSDIQPDLNGDVLPGEHGLSVSPSIEKLPMMLLPRRLHDRFPKAVGNNNLQIWKMGNGAWGAGEVADGLRLELDSYKPDSHGLVGPNKTMPLAKYCSAVTATQESWSAIQGI